MLIPTNVPEALHWIEVGAAVATVVASLELLAVRRTWIGDGAWAWKQVAPSFPQSGVVFGDAPFTLVVVLRMVAAAWLAFAPGMCAAVLLWITALLVNVRFRGPWNGGSDHMLLLVTTAIAIGEAGRSSDLVVQGAVAWVGVQSILSYAMAGFAKLRTGAWRDGSALPVLLAIPAYGVPSGMRRVVAVPALARLGAWSVLAFECGFPLVLLGPHLALGGVALAALFHLANAWTFGLNRFLLTWAVTWPAVVWVATRVGGS
jgi:hypothetical protein